MDILTVSKLLEEYQMNDNDNNYKAIIDEDTGEWLVIILQNSNQQTNISYIDNNSTSLSTDDDVTTSPYSATSSSINSNIGSTSSSSNVNSNSSSPNNNEDSLDTEDNEGNTYYNLNVFDNNNSSDILTNEHLNWLSNDFIVGNEPPRLLSQQSVISELDKIENENESRTWLEPTTSTSTEMVQSSLINNNDQLLNHDQWFSPFSNVNNSNNTNQLMTTLSNSGLNETGIIDLQFNNEFIDQFEKNLSRIDLLDDSQIPIISSSLNNSQGTISLFISSFSFF
jgi:hypothetical protein